MKTIQPAHRDLLYVALFLHDIAKGRVEDHSIAGARIARRFCPRLGLSPAETETVAWLVEQHLVMSTIAQSRDLSDRKTIENFAGVVQSLERMKLLADPDRRGHPRGRARRVEFLEGAAAAHALLRDRAGADRRLLRGRPRSAASRWRKPNSAHEMKDWAKDELDAYIARHYPAYWLKVDLTHKVSHAHFLKSAHEAEQGGRDRRRLRHRARRDRAHRARARPSAAALGDRRRLRGGGRQHRRRADLHHHRRARARHHRGVARVRAQRGRGAPRGAHRGFDRARAARRAAAARGDGEARRAARAGSRPSRSSPRCCINNQWSNRYTVIEVTGLDRPGLLYELTATISKLSLNIASAHVATFGERVVDVFYVTDLTRRADHLADRARPRSSARCCRCSSRRSARPRRRGERRSLAAACPGLDSRMLASAAMS